MTGGAGVQRGWGAVALNHKSSRIHPSIRGGRGTETRLERVLEREDSEEVGDGKCRQPFEET